MDLKIQQTSQRGAVLARNWLAGGLFLSLIINVILAGLAAGRETTTILIPATISADEYRINGSAVSESYLTDMAHTAAVSFLNIRPGMTEAAREKFLKLLHPAAYGRFGTLWDQMLNDIRQRDISTIFYPLVLRADLSALRVELEGQFVTFLGQSRSEEARTYILEFSTDTGPLLLVGFKEKGASE